MLKGNYEKAVELTNSALKDNEEYAPAWDNLGQIYYNQGDYKRLMKISKRLSAIEKYG